MIAQPTDHSRRNRRTPQQRIVTIGIKRHVTNLAEGFTMMLQNRVPVRNPIVPVQAETQPCHTGLLVKHRQPGRIGTAITHAIKHRYGQLAQRLSQLGSSDQQSDDATHVP